VKYYSVCWKKWNKVDRIRSHAVTTLY